MTTNRRAWMALPGLSAVAAAAILLSAWQGRSLTPERGSWGYSAASSKQGYAPQQPISFPHPVHVKTIKLNCLYCHYAANKGPDPGMPAVSTCMGCHQIIGPDLRDSANPARTRRSADLVKLTKYFTEKQPIPWVRIHKVPDYVNFPHMRHVSAGVACQSCHGDVQNMNRVFQFASLNMGWCVNCHVSGYTPPTAVPEGFAGYAASRASDSRSPVDSTPPAMPGPSVGSTTYPRRARYDCSTCHY